MDERAIASGVLEPLPEKQGLKLFSRCMENGVWRCIRATSRKTRIETAKGLGFGTNNVRVLEPLPEKQGLKQAFVEGKLAEEECIRATSRKTRIETLKVFFFNLK